MSLLDELTRGAPLEGWPEPVQGPAPDPYQTTGLPPIDESLLGPRIDPRQEAAKPPIGLGLNPMKNPRPGQTISQAALGGAQALGMPLYGYMKAEEAVDQGVTNFLTGLSDDPLKQKMLEQVGTAANLMRPDVLAPLAAIGAGTKIIGGAKVSRGQETMAYAQKYMNPNAIARVDKPLGERLESGRLFGETASGHIKPAELPYPAIQGVHDELFSGTVQDHGPFRTGGSTVANKELDTEIGRANYLKKAAAQPQDAPSLPVEVSDQSIDQIFEETRQEWFDDILKNNDTPDVEFLRDIFRSPVQRYGEVGQSAASRVNSTTMGERLFYETGTLAVSKTGLPQDKVNFLRKSGAINNGPFTEMNIATYGAIKDLQGGRIASGQFISPGALGDSMYDIPGAPKIGFYGDTSLALLGKQRDGKLMDMPLTVNDRHAFRPFLPRNMKDPSVQEMLYKYYPDLQKKGKPVDMDAVISRLQANPYAHLFLHRFFTRFRDHINMASPTDMPLETWQTQAIWWAGERNLTVPEPEPGLIEALQEQHNALKAEGVPIGSEKVGQFDIPVYTEEALRHPMLAEKIESIRPGRGVRKNMNILGLDDKQITSSGLASDYALNVHAEHLPSIEGEPIAKRIVEAQEELRGRGQHDLKIQKLYNEFLNDRAKKESVYTAATHKGMKNVQGAFGEKGSIYLYPGNSIGSWGDNVSLNTHIPVNPRHTKDIVATRGAASVIGALKNQEAVGMHQTDFYGFDKGRKFEDPHVVVWAPGLYKLDPGEQIRIGEAVKKYLGKDGFILGATAAPDGYMLKIMPGEGVDMESIENVLSGAGNEIMNKRGLQPGNPRVKAYYGRSELWASDNYADFIAEAIGNTKAPQGKRPINMASANRTANAIIELGTRTSINAGDVKKALGEFGKRNPGLVGHVLEIHQSVHGGGKKVGLLKDYEKLLNNNKYKKILGGFLMSLGAGAGLPAIGEEQ